MLIALEGIDGTGKSTIQGLLAAHLREKGKAVVTLCEPTKESEWGRKVRDLAERHQRPGAEEETELFIKDRRYDVDRNIQPALEKGKIVIIDRYYLSTMAYQGALGLDPEKIRERNEGFAPVPDLAIIIDLDPEVGLKRVDNRGSATGFEKLDYLRKVRKIYLSMRDYDFVETVDGEGSVKEVFSRVKEVVDQALGENEN